MTQFATNQVLVPTGGTQIVDGTSAITSFKSCCIQATADTVISVCTGINGNDDTTTVNFKTDTKYNWLNLKAGDVLYTKNADYITAITLTSGRILLHKI